MEWFYAESDIRKGPVSDREIAGLIAARKIDHDTLVWNQTMADWKPAGVTSLFTTSTQSAPQPPIPPGHHLCIITGKSFPESQMLKTEHGWVSVEGKGQYYQSMREGAPIPLADGQTNARADGNKIVIPLLGGKLPPRCVKTNQPISTDRVRARKLYWCNPAIYLAILIGWPIVIILYFVLRKKVMLDVPLSSEGQRAVTNSKLISVGVLLAGLITMGFGFSGTYDNQAAAVPLVVAGILMLLGSLVFASRKAQVLRVSKIRGNHAWVVGASREYVASLPSYP